jgi:5-methylcytosine-specific restriction endonuclease McrA
MGKAVPKIKLSSLKLNPDNPRIIKGDRFEKLKNSIKDFPKMMDLLNAGEYNFDGEVTVLIGQRGKRFCECKSCGKWFHANGYMKNIPRLFCSKECYAENLRKYRICPICGKRFTSYPNTKFCSIECSKIGRKSSKGTKLPEKWRKALSDARKNSPKCKGENLWNWRGGKETFLERSKIYHNNRRARFVNGGILDPIFLKHLWVIHSGKCFYCGKLLIGKEYKCLEHLTPLIKGGDNMPYNLVYSCRSCNSKKRQETFEEYAIKRGKSQLIEKWEYYFSYAFCRAQEEKQGLLNA